MSDFRLQSRGWPAEAYQRHPDPIAGGPVFRQEARAGVEEPAPIVEQPQDEFLPTLKSYLPTGTGCGFYFGVEF